MGIMLCMWMTVMYIDAPPHVYVYVYAMFPALLPCW